MKIYTKTGDKGTTGVIGGRVGKDHCRVEAYGTIDELNSWIGFAITQLVEPKFAEIVEVLSDIQQRLFDCCADLATVDTSLREYRIDAEAAQTLEPLIDQFTRETPEIDHFIVPGGSQPAATLHICRTVARRAERRVVTLIQQEETVNAEVMRFLNRLSDLLYTLARTCNARAGVQDVLYLRD